MLLGLALFNVNFFAIFFVSVYRNNCCFDFCFNDCVGIDVIIVCFCCDCNKPNRLSNAVLNAHFMNLMRELFCFVEKPGI